MRKMLLTAALLPLAYYGSAQSLGQSEDRVTNTNKPGVGEFDMTGFHAGLNTGIYYTQMIDRAMFDSPSYNFGSTWKAAPIGLTLGYNWQNRYGVQVEGNLQRLGQKMTILDVTKSEVGTKEINLTYVQIPLLFKIMAGEGRARFNFHIGPQLSVLTEGTDKEYYSKTDLIFHNTQDEPVDEIAGQTLSAGSEIEIIKGSTDKDAALAGSGYIPYQFNKTILGGLFGFGTEVNVGSGFYLTGNLRLGYNFSEIRKEGEGAETKFRDYVDLSGNNRRYLYNQEARNFVFGGFHFGVHYLFNQNEH
jgi:hypothetical protein